MADKGKKYTVGKIVAPVAKPKVKPKAKPKVKKPKAKGNTLYVTDPNDRRLQMYNDSSLATGRAINQNKAAQGLGKMPIMKAADALNRGVATPPDAKAAISRLEKANRKPYKEGSNKSIDLVSLKAPEGYGWNPNDRRMSKGGASDEMKVHPTNVLTPKRKVVLVKPEEPKPEPKPKPKPVAPPRPKPDPVEKLEIRPADTQIVKPKEEKEREVKMRPLKEPRKEKRIGVGDILQYPAMNMNILEKIKARVTGKNPMPYYTDKKGVKRYGSRGESNPQANYEKDMLKEGLNPKDANDKATLGRIEARYKTPSKEE